MNELKQLARLMGGGVIGTIGVVVFVLGLCGAFTGVAVGILVPLYVQTQELGRPLTAELLFSNIIVPFGIIGSMALIFGGVYWFVLRPILQGMGTQESVLANGTPGAAIILQLADTGVLVNRNPQVELLLEVHSANRPPYQATVRTIVSKLDVVVLQPGEVLRVKIDPQDPQKVAVAGAVTGVNVTLTPAVDLALIGPDANLHTQRAKAHLTLIDMANTAISEIGVSAPGIILKRTDMGIIVNGNNPVVTLLIEVKPTTLGQSNFQVETKAVISAISEAKFQPGKPLWVKFNPQDPTQATVERSGE